MLTGYGCPFAHLLSACTCYISKNFNDKNVAAHLKFEPHMPLSRRRKSLLLRSYDISAQFCAARLSLMTALLISNILDILRNSSTYLLNVCICLVIPAVRRNCGENGRAALTGISSSRDHKGSN